MSLTTPSKIRELQIKLYRRAKNEPGYTRWWTLICPSTFDTIPHCELMQCVARRIVDREVIPNGESSTTPR